MFLFYLALTLLLAYPLTLNPATTILADSPDTHLIMWILGWDTHALVHHPLSIFDANIYFPRRLTLAYSENLIGSALVAAPVFWLTGNAVLALNVVTLISCALCGVGAWLLARRVGVGALGAALCGLVFAFSPARFSRITQLHLTTVQWVPFTLAFLHAYLDGGRPRDLRLAAAFFSLQALTSGHGAVFAGLATLALLVYRAASGEPIAFARRLRDCGVMGAVLLGPAVLVCLPYRAVQLELGLRRSLEDWIPTPESFMASPTTVHTWLLSLLPGTPVNDTASAYLFPGYLPLVLGAVALLWPGVARGHGVPAPVGRAWTRAALLVEIAAIVSMAVSVFVSLVHPITWRIDGTLVFAARDPLRAWAMCAVVVALRMALVSRAPVAIGPRFRRNLDACRRWVKARRQDPTTFYGLLTLASVMVSAGPPIGLWPLVYWLPGLNFIRVPSRFMILAVLGLAVLSGIGFDRLSARVGPGKRRLLATALGVLMIIEFAGIPLETVPFKVEAPAVERWLAGQTQPFVVAEAPVMPTARSQTTYMLHSMAHWQKTIHGYSGVQAALHDELYRRLRDFPDEAGLQSLAGLGVTYIVVHTEMYDRDEWAATEQRLSQFQQWLTLEHEEDGGRVYSLRRPSPSVDYKK